MMFLLSLLAPAAEHVTVDDAAASFDNIEKSGVGFERGPKAGHKYWRRVRALVQGKLGWVYYYNTPADRAKYTEDRERKRKRDNAKTALNRVQRKVEAEADKRFGPTAIVTPAPAPGSPGPDQPTATPAPTPGSDPTAKLKSEFLADHPELRAKRATWDELNEEYVQGLFGMKAPPTIKGTDAVKAMFGAAIVAHYGDGGDPEDLHGEKMHWLRAAEMAVKLIPAPILAACDGQMKDMDFTLASEDAYLSAAGNESVLGYAERTSGRICLGADRIGLGGGGGNTRALFGGLTPVHVIVHEMSHQIHNKMMKDADQPLTPGGLTWNEWLDHYNTKLKRTLPPSVREAGITPYAETNEKEAWAESFSASLMYPHMMAHQCPETYEQMRKFFGADKLRPRVTDDAEIRRLQAAIATATGADKESLLAQLEMSEGLDKMGPDDPRLEWWKGRPASPIEKLVKAARSDAPNYHESSLTFADPPDEDAVGKQGEFDRFYEMNNGARTVFVRVGPDGGNNGGDWDPDSSATSAANVVLRPEQVKECYDEEGRPIDRQLVYWHLHQDVLTNPNEVVGEATIGKGATEKTIAVTVKDIAEYGLQRGGSSGRDEGTETEQAIKKVLEANSIEKWMRTLTADSYRVEGASGEMGWRPATGGRGGGTASLETYDKWAAYQTKNKLPTDKALFERERELYVAQRKMAPQEVDHHTFRQRSGTFNYDRIDLAGQKELDELAHLGGGKTERLPTGELVLSKEQEGRNRELLERLREVQPGIETVQTRNKKGQLEAARVVVDEGGKPRFVRKRWVNSNPDGTQSVFFTARGPDGNHYLEDPMWKALLTPNGEAIRSASHLEKLCRDAAGEKRKVWVSVKTDRPRVKNAKGKWIVAEAGDIAHYYHLQVEFDGHGQPKLLGPEWAERLGTDTPRIDQLLEDDKVIGQFRGEAARPILPAEQIKLAPEVSKSGTPKRGDRVILSVRANELAGKAAKDKEVVAWLTKVIPGKDAGQVPDPPGWDRMPDGSPTLKNRPGELPQKLVTFKRGGVSISEKDLRQRGLIPPWYVGSVAQRDWLEKHYIPAYVGWNTTKEAETSKEYPAQYIFDGETGGGAGRRTFRRYGEEAVLADSRWPETTHVPAPLQTQTLVYMHKTVDPRTGATITKEARLALPADGTLTAHSVEGLPGVEVEWDDEKLKTRALAIRLKLGSFNNFRTALGGLSLTDEVNRTLHDRIEMLRESAQRKDDDEHVLETGQIEPGWLIDNWGVDLQRTLPSGQTFVLPDHQQRALQKTLDNNGRALLAHYMGTGKTIEAIVAAKMMMARPDPADPTKKHPDNPKRVLIVAPLNTVEQWRQAAGDFDGGAQVVGSGANDIPIDEFIKLSESGKGDLVVCGPEYFTLHADKLKAAGFDGLIIDEVHLGVKNEEAERNRKVKEWNPDMKMMLLLTGTPMTTSPADVVEYIRLLSNGKQWADMTTERFTEEFLEPTSVVDELGEGGKKGPKIQVKAAKRAELATILAQWMDIALPKDVKGKTLPAVRIEENQHAFMTGIQAQLYNLYMATAGGDVDAGALAEEERGRLSPDARRAVAAAKAVVNCPAYKPGSTEMNITYEVEVPGKSGKLARQKKVFETFNPTALMDKSRGKAAGKWPLSQELPIAELAIYNLMFRAIFDGKSYDEVAGTKITKEQLARMNADGWPHTVPNPDRGPLGIRARGLAVPWVDVQNKLIDEAIKKGDNTEADRLTAAKDKRLAEIDRALAFQRHVRKAVGEWPAKDAKPFAEMLTDIAADAGIDLDEAEAMMQVHPVPTITQTVVTVQSNGKSTTIDSQETIKVNGVEYLRNAWVSDKKGSLHLLYAPQDWDETKNQPRSRGGFEAVHVGEVVSVSAKGLKEAGIVAPKMPSGLTKEQRDDWASMYDDWEAPGLKYMGGDPDAKGNIPLTRLDTHEVVYVPKDAIAAQVASIFDPGKRAERERADIVMTMGNAKADELGAHIQRFHADSGPGRDGARQMVLFGNGILDSCRTMEAKLRQMGFRDANECIDGSPHFDKADPDLGANGQSPNGKYFVTYIGATATGDRELNVAIFQKVKDKLGRDSDVSLFVAKTTEPRSPTTLVDPETKQKVEVNWGVYPGDTAPQAVRMSQWSPEQREAIKAQFGIRAPESFVEVEQPGGTTQRLLFYGTAKSATMLRTIALQPDPTKLPAEEAAKVRATIAKLKADYQTEALANASTEPPLTAHQTTVFNNCEAIICSDAAQVGMNLGNSVEMVMFDSLGSPMAEWQRITRCARMLPAAVEAKLIGKPVYEPLMVKKRDEDGNVVKVDGKAVMVEKKDDNGETVMVHAFDELGRAKYDGSGPFSKLREMEKAMFAAGPREHVAGTIRSLALSPAFPNAGKDMGIETFESALARIRVGALDKAQELRQSGASGLAKAREWEAIAAKAAYAANLGTNAARAMFDEMAATTTPGGTDRLIAFAKGAIKYEDPEAGTYEGVRTLEPEARLRAAIDQLPEAEQQAIMKSGFRTVAGGADSHDPVAVYMAIRAGEILDWIVAKRDEVGADMRASEGGKVITDADVTNRLIDMLPPEDRAILKTKKYLVNVRKLGGAAHVGQVVRNVYKDDEGNVVAEKVHTGYEQEQPVRTERGTRALGRARMITFEQILTDVQNGVDYIPPEGFVDTTALAYANASRTGIKKGLPIYAFFDMRDLGVPFSEETP